MSLINDALRRAKAAQPNAATPADGPAMHPAREPHPVASAGNDFLLPAMIMIIFLLAAMLLWMWFRSGSDVIKVRARTTAEALQPVTAPMPAVPSENPQSAIRNPQLSEATPTTSTTNAQPAIVSTNTVAATNLAPAVPAPPPPVTYKLQSIFYRAKNPSAVINGKTLFIGGHVGEAHVVAITEESVTIVTKDGTKKVLELPN